MDDLTRWEMGDPMLVAERRQEQSCHGCRYLAPVGISGERIFYCDKGRIIEKKCKHYKRETK